MLQDTDKLLLFGSGTHLKVPLPLLVPTHDGSGLSHPEECDSGHAPGSTHSEAHGVDVETRLHLGIPDPNSSSPEAQPPWRAVATLCLWCHHRHLALGRPAAVTAAVPVCRGILIPPQCHRGQELVSSSSLLAGVCNRALKGQKLLEVLSNNESFLMGV